MWIQFSIITSSLYDIKYLMVKLLEESHELTAFIT